MGTHAYYVFRYKNKWYVFYNHFDSCPYSLGDDIVRELSTINFEKLKECIEKIKDEDINLNGSTKYTSLMCAVENPNQYCFELIQDRQTDLDDGDVEYVYTVDLDNEMFHVEYYSKDGRPNTQRFKLDSIPEHWKELIFYT